MNKKLAMFFKACFCVLCLALLASPGYCVDANNAKPILWRSNDYGSVSPLNFTVAYVQSTDLTSGQKDEIKEVVSHWAVGMYEMTNARHQLGSIKVILVSEDVRENFHVLWREEEKIINNNSAGIHAGLGSYVPYAQQGRLYGSILFNWREIDVKRPNYNLTGQRDNTLRFGGYTLAHESAHILYSVRDEYKYGFGGAQPLRVNADMAIMNDHGKAIFAPAQTVDEDGVSVTRPGSPKWLNFSTEYNYYDVTNKDLGLQWGMYGASAWDAITSQDAAIRLQSLYAMTGYFYRKYWFEDLADAKPQGTSLDLQYVNDWYRIEYTDGLPPQGAANFDPPGNSQKSEKKNSNCQPWSSVHRRGRASSSSTTPRPRSPRTILPGTRP
jgi:hypothetical protein